MGQTLFCEKDREVGPTGLLCQFPRQPAAGWTNWFVLIPDLPKEKHQKSARGAQAKYRRQAEPELHQIAVNISKYNQI
jgi:hypothetical protein